MTVVIDAVTGGGETRWPSQVLVMVRRDLSISRDPREAPRSSPWPKPTPGGGDIVASIVAGLGPAPTMRLARGACTSIGIFEGAPWGRW